MTQKRIKEQIQYLSSFALEQRLKQLKKVLNLRTRYITVGLENIYQPQNASAVLRTCEAFGIQDVHIIEQVYKFNVNPDVAMGTNKWLDLYKYNGRSVIAKLRSKGYRIVATTPSDTSKSLNDFDLHKGKIALFFGTELSGLSDELMQDADEFIHIPMYGFVESFNISVSVSIILYQLSKKLRESDISWRLTEGEYDTLLLHWLKSSVRSSNLLLERFFNNN